MRLTHLILALSFAFGVFVTSIGARANDLANDFSEELHAGPALKQLVEVDSHHVTLGDLFANAGKRAGIALFRAPEPGQSFELTLRQAAKLARRAGMAWDMTGAPAIVHIKRASTSIAHESVMEELMFALEDVGAVAPLRLNIGDQRLDIHLPQNSSALFEIRRVQYDRRTGSFSAEIASDLDSPIPQTRRIMGRAFTITEIPVLKTAMPGGHIVRAQDIAWVEMRVDRLTNNVIMAEKQLVGMEIRRRIAAGKPIKARDLRRPALIQKGQTVVMRYQRGGLVLSTTGKALNDGAMGDLIEIRNMQSDRAVTAEVIGKNAVRIATGEQLVSASR